MKRIGPRFESEALDHFIKESKATVKRCGLFKDPTDSRFGASPDALGPAGILAEVKTRAAQSTSPLTSINGSPHYFVQCQLQMKCTGAQFTILQSYHPESKSSHYFLIERDNLLISVVKEVAVHLLEKEPVHTWDHNEKKVLQNSGSQLMNKVPNFENLKLLRLYIKSLVRKVKQTKFVDNFSDSI